MNRKRDELLNFTDLLILLSFQAVKAGIIPVEAEACLAVVVATAILNPPIHMEEVVEVTLETKEEAGKKQLEQAFRLLRLGILCV
jgi:hypothetical protein